MTSTVFDHYQNHLAPVYSWMVGDFELACEKADSFYESFLPKDCNGKIAIDLGCGHGVHSIPLARRGFQVLALDSSSHLLDELRSISGELSVDAIQGDMLNFTEHLGGEKASLIVCMGDTLTHLPSTESVDSVIRDAAMSLKPEGVLTFSFRDYTGQELEGAGRFIPVRSDKERIHTCFLEYHPETILVHDIIHSLVNGEWQISVSCYPKLRLSPEHVVETAKSFDLSLFQEENIRGMRHLVFKCC